MLTLGLIIVRGLFGWISVGSPIRAKRNEETGRGWNSARSDYEYYVAKEGGAGSIIVTALVLAADVWLILSALALVL